MNKKWLLNDIADICRNIDKLSEAVDCIQDSMEELFEDLRFYDSYPYTSLNKIDEQISSLYDEVADFLKDHINKIEDETEEDNNEPFVRNS